MSTTLNLSQINADQLKAFILEQSYPVGSIYQSTSPLTVAQVAEKLGGGLGSDTVTAES